MRKLRLLVTDVCLKQCEGCCNNDWDLANLPQTNDLKGYDEIILTGGEPMLLPCKVAYIIGQARTENPAAKIYMYTADTTDTNIHTLMMLLDGITITLHTTNDYFNFKKFYNHAIIDRNKSLRLYAFKGISFDGSKYPEFKIFKDRVWIRGKCLPKDEVFMRYEI